MSSPHNATANSHNTQSNNAHGDYNIIGDNNRLHVITHPSAVDEHKIDLPYIQGASWDISLTCGEGTRTAIIQGIRDWVFGRDTTPPAHSQRLYFIIGGIHSGKSTISHTVAEILDTDDEPTLASAIFLSQTTEPITVRMIVNTIAVDLASHDARIKENMSAKLRKHFRLRDASAAHLFRQLVVSSMVNIASDTPIVIILDVLDRLSTLGERTELLHILAQNSARLPPNVRILVTARPSADVLEMIHKNHCARRFISLSDEPGADLEAVISSTADDLVAHRHHIVCRHLNFLADALQGSTASPTAVSILSTFLIHCSDEELTCFLDTARLISGEIPDLEWPGRLYFLILWAIVNYGLENHPTGELSLLSFLMGPRSADDQPQLSLEDITFDDLLSGSIFSAIAPASASSESNQEFILHPDIVEFVVAPPPQVLVSPPSGHPARNRIAELCLQILCDELVFNPLSINTTLDSRLEPGDLKEQIQEHISMPVNYASRHVIAHITAAAQSGLPRIVKLFQQFLSKHTLHWLELLSYLGAFGRSTMIDLEGLLQCLKSQPEGVEDRDDLCEWVSDVLEFTRRFSPLILKNPLQLSLAAAYSPSRSRIYQTLQSGSPVRVISGIPENWEPCLGIIDWVGSSLALSPDGRRLAIGKGDIGIWDTSTRCHLYDLPSGSRSEHHLAFSPDSTKLSSASGAGLMHLWDAQTGSLVHGFGGPGPVRGIAYSPDGKSLASALSDYTLRVWDLESGGEIRTPLSQHTDHVNRVIYSPDGRYLASASNDKTVRVWDLDTWCAVGRIDHSNRVFGFAWSPDGALIGTGCDDHIVRLWDSETHAMVIQLTGHSNSVRSIAFTPDSSKLVSGSVDWTVRAWDVTTGMQLGCFRGHTNIICVVIVCPDCRTIISSSRDGTVRFWDMLSPNNEISTSASVATTGVANGSPERLAEFANASLSFDGWITNQLGQRLLWVPYPYRGWIIVRQDGRLVVKERNQTGDTLEELVLELL